MAVWVYARRRNAEAADALARKLRSQGVVVSRGNSKFYDGVIRGTDQVYHDGLVPQIAVDHEALGIPVHLFLDSARPAAPAAPPQPAAPEPPGSTEPAAPTEGALPPDHHVEQKGMWFTLYGPAGKIGKAQRSYDEAVAQLGAGD